MNSMQACMDVCTKHLYVFDPSIYRGWCFGVLEDYRVFKILFMMHINWMLQGLIFSKVNT